MRRRELIALIGGAAATWPVTVQAQPTERMRRIGVLMDATENNPVGQTRVAGLLQGLHELGWTDGPKLRIDTRWSGGDAERSRAYAAEFVELKYDVIFTFGNAQLRTVSLATSAIPLVFVGASDPVGAGYATSFARPSGNITGFTLYEPSMVGKWVAALKEIAPSLGRVALMLNPETATLRGKFYSGVFEAAAATLTIEPTTVAVRTANEIEAAIATLAQRPDIGLIVHPDSFFNVHQRTILARTAEHGLPAIYGVRSYALSGGLMSYGPDAVDACRRAASYIDRILRGEKPGELPIQTPTKFDFVINLKTAKTLGLTVPSTMLVRADEVIE